MRGQVLRAASVLGLIGVLGAKTFGAPSAAAEPAASSVGVRAWLGNLHAHTALSDGTGTPAEAYATARAAGLDFFALTEHNHMLGGPEAAPALSAGAYAELLAAAERATEPGPNPFVALTGQEFSSISKGNHVNVLDVDAPIDVPNGAFDQLLVWLGPRRDASGAPPVVQLNHPDFGSMKAGAAALEYGRDDFGDDAGWVRAMGGAASLIELLNGEPAEGDTSGRAPQVMEASYARFLQLGFRVGPTGNQDNHRATWGAASAVRTGVWATALTRPALLAALRARHVYASEDTNLRLVARAGDALFGDVVGTRPVTVTLDLEDPDEPRASYTVEAWRGEVGGAPAAPVVTWTVQGDGHHRLDQPVRLDDPRSFFFLRVTQAGTTADRAWTAPVWASAPTP